MKFSGFRPTARRLRLRIRPFLPHISPYFWHFAAFASVCRDPPGLRRLFRNLLDSASPAWLGPARPGSRRTLLLWVCARIYIWLRCMPIYIPYVCCLSIYMCSMSICSVYILFFLKVGGDEKDGIGFLFLPPPYVCVILILLGLSSGSCPDGFLLRLGILPRICPTTNCLLRDTRRRSQTAFP